MLNTTIQQLSRNDDFSKISLQNNPIEINDSRLTTILNTDVQYMAPNEDNLAGTWIVNGQKVSAGVILCSAAYNGFLSSDAQIQTHLNAMATNTAWSKAASTFASSVKALADSYAPQTYDKLLELAAGPAATLGVSAQQFLRTVLPNENESRIYTTEQLNSLKTAVDQFSNAKLTDNSVLQNKLNVATSTRQSCLDAVSNILKGWISNMQALRGGL